jgi:putative oxidoreductase
VKRSWFSSSAHDSGRSLDIVRDVVAIILIIHPIYAFSHPGDIRGFGQFLQSHGFSLGVGLAWAVMFLQAGCSLALVVRRLVTPACVGQIFVLGMGIWLVHAPKWRTVGLPDGDHHPGSEFSVLLIACLLGVFWAHWRRAAEESSLPEHADLSTRRGLEVIRVAAALILVIHPFGGLRDPAGLHDLGLYFSSIGFPFGVPLVWSVMFLQIACSTALVARRFVVPACIGHISVLITGICLFHAPHWFAVGPGNVVGPGKEGMEYSVLLITCFFSVLLSYWPKQQQS